MVEMRKPAAGIIVHVGEVVQGEPAVGDMAIARVDAQRRQDIMRNHTATHLLHAELRTVLGEHARQAGSLVAPDRLRFDFTHPQAVTAEAAGADRSRRQPGYPGRLQPEYQLSNPCSRRSMKARWPCLAKNTARSCARSPSEGRDPFSYELCGGTHVDETGDIGLFLITSEGSAAAGIRRIEAVTGRGAYELVKRRFRVLKQASDLLSAPQDEVTLKIQDLMADLGEARKQITGLKQLQAQNAMIRHLDVAAEVKGVRVLTATLDDVDAETLGR